MDQTKDFLGSGWKFPPRLDSRGRIELVHQEQDIDEAIRLIIMTRPGERPMRPEFGCHIHELFFSPNDPSSAGLAKRYVFEALARWEPRIEVQDVVATVDPERDNCLLVRVNYRVPATNNERNLVFPFYTIPGE